MASKKVEIKRTEEGFYICNRCGGYFEEKEMTRGRFGITGICMTCTGKAHSDGAKNRAAKQEALKHELNELRMENADLKRQLREIGNHALDACTPRDLMRELHKRGYSGKLEYTKVTEVDISKLD